MRLLLISAVVVLTQGGEIHFKDESRLKNVRQLTFGGQNAEGYFSFDGKWLTFQAAGMDAYGTLCDQIYRIDLTLPPAEQIPHRISTGLGSCTCSYFYPDNRHLIYAGTFQGSKFNSNETLESCPQKRCQSPEAKTDPVLKELCNSSYIWDLFPAYDIFKVNEYGKIVSQLTTSAGYDAEGAISPDGKHIVFTSVRSGDPEIWIMDSDGSNPKQLTHELGYDGGPFFSTDGTKICFRASRPNTTEDIAKYKALLSYNLVAATAMELYTINIDGSNISKVTALGGSNWAPFYFPDDHRIIFSTNFNSTGHFGAFDLYMVDEDGKNLERVTYNEGGFDSFPMFDRKTQRLVWGSSRNGSHPMELNLFIADWIEMDGSNTTKGEDESSEEDNRTKGIAHRRVHRDYDATLAAEESHLKNVRQMTFEGINGQAYFSYDERSLIFQGMGNTTYQTTCDQIYALDVANPRRIPRRVSTGLGSCTCSYFFPNGDALYAGTFLSANWSSLDTCPRKACTYVTDPVVQQYCKTSYLWDLFPDYEIFKVNKYGNFIRRLTNSPGYDSEASVSPDGRRIVFTSMRSGDPEIWIMNQDGSGLKKLTSELGYDGGASFSHDGKKIVFRASRPQTGKELDRYKLLLSNNLVEPTRMEIFVMNVDGSDQRRVTSLGGANWSPTYLRGDQRILFASNFNSSLLGSFNLYAINENGTDLEQITFTDGEFNGFSSASSSGERVTWSGNGGNLDLNIFVADWTDSDSDKTPNGASALFPARFLESFPVARLAEAIAKTWDIIAKLTH